MAKRETKHQRDARAAQEQALNARQRAGVARERDADDQHPD